MELPPLSQKEREQAVLNRLRGWYPGKLDDKYIVILPNGKRNAYLALVFEDSLRDDPLSISTLAAVKLCKKGRQNCVIVWDGWVEYLILEEGRVLSSMVTSAEEQLSEQLAVHAVEWFSSNGTSRADTAEPVEKKQESLIKVFCAAADCPAEAAVVAGDFIFYYVALEKTFLPFSRSSWSCFPERLPEVRRRRRLFAIVAGVAAVILMIVVRDWYGQREAENAARRETARRNAMEMAEQKAREDRLAALKEAWEEQLKEQYVGVYATIETLASCLSPAIRLSSATVKEDGSFRLEGSTADAIAALEDLQTHPETRNATIGTIIWDGRLERFTVNGTVERLPLLPEEYLAADEKITWYETVLANSVKNGAMPETAATAAQQIRDLLERHHLNITRFRYLDAQGGWAIECAVSGTGIQVVQALKEADTTGSMRITALETRNRQNGLDAVITFFTRGPGERYQFRNYEAHPSIARIASLYGTLPGHSSATPVPVQQITETGLPAIPPQITSLSGSLEYVGFIGTADGKRFIYVKDTKSGELYRLTEGEGSYSYRINSAGFISATLAGSLSPVEVRRNDGF
jgi:hypothetical protein